MKTISIFVSGNGTNCENIIRHFLDNSSIRIGLVISNKPEAYALVRAAKYSVPCKVLTKTEINDENIIMPLLSEYQIDFIVLAGFMLMVPEFIVNHFNRRIINIHPSLLPKFGGKGMYGHNVHKAVKAAGETETGITIHFVSNICDGGEIIARFKTTVSKDDTAEDIESKVHELEKRFFPEVIERVVNENMTNF